MCIRFMQRPAIKRITPALETGFTKGFLGFSEYLFLQIIYKDIDVVTHTKFSNFFFPFVRAAMDQRKRLPFASISSQARSLILV